MAQPNAITPLVPKNISSTFSGQQFTSLNLWATTKSLSPFYYHYYYLFLHLSLAYPNLLGTRGRAPSIAGWVRYPWRGGTDTPPPDPTMPWWTGGIAQLIAGRPQLNRCHNFLSRISLSLCAARYSPNKYCHGVQRFTTFEIYYPI